MEGVLNAAGTEACWGAGRAQGGIRGQKGGQARLPQGSWDKLVVVLGTWNLRGGEGCGKGISEKAAVSVMGGDGEQAGEEGQGTSLFGPFSEEEGARLAALRVAPWASVRRWLGGEEGQAAVLFPLGPSWLVADAR